MASRDRDRQREEEWEREMAKRKWHFTFMVMWVQKTLEETAAKGSANVCECKEQRAALKGADAVASAGAEAIRAPANCAIGRQVSWCASRVITNFASKSIKRNRRIYNAMRTIKSWHKKIGALNLTYTYEYYVSFSSPCLVVKLHFVAVRHNSTELCWSLPERRTEGKTCMAKSFIIKLFVWPPKIDKFSAIHFICAKCHSGAYPMPNRQTSSQTTL